MKDYKISGIYLFRSQNEELLYVGKTCNLSNRVRQHLAEDKEWKNDIYYVDFYSAVNESDREILETYCINLFEPVFNSDKVYNTKPEIKIELPEKHRFLLEDVYRPVLKYYIGTFKECCKQVVEDNYVPEEVAKYYPTIKEGYEKLGIKKLKALGYCSTKIKNELINLEYTNLINIRIKQLFKSGEFYTAKEVKEKLNQLYKELNINKKAKCTDMEKVLKINVTVTRIEGISTRCYNIP